MSRRSLQSKWERLLAREGMPGELRQARPRPTLDRNWANHFGGYGPKDAARNEAVARLKLDARSASDLFSMLADIRWGRSEAMYPPETLTAHEHEVFDPYCDGQSFEQIAQLLSISTREAKYRFYEALARFTHIRPRMRRNHD